jgi:hypothetical protein
MLKHLTAAAALLIAAAPANASTAPESIADFAADQIVESCYVQFWQRYSKADIAPAELVARGLLNHGRNTTALQAFIPSCVIGRGKMKGARK